LPKQIGKHKPVNDLMTARLAWEASNLLATDQVVGWLMSVADCGYFSILLSKGGNLQ